MPVQKLLLVFGRNPELSMLEAKSFLQASRGQFEILEISEEAMLIQAGESLKPERLAKELAGTVKIGRVLIEEEVPGGDFARLQESLDAIDFTRDFGKKFNYSISDYGSEKNEELFDYLLDYFKQSFKSQRLKAVLKWPKEIQGNKKNTIAPTLLAKRIEESMLDFFIYSSNGKALFGKTVAVNNPLEFAKRDDERPLVKHELVTSARLARILVNIAGLEKGKAILDPFCGIGGVMQEILLSGHDAIGIEQSAENASACEKNLEWCCRKFSSQQKFRIFKNDSRMLSEFLKKGDFHAVVTEPFMGPFLKKLPSAQNAENIARELHALYGAVFRELSRLMQSGQKVVFMMPQFKTIEGRKIKVQESCFLNSGFKKFNPLEKEKQGIVPVLYKDSESRIERLVYVLEKS